MTILGDDGKMFSGAAVLKMFNRSTKTRMDAQIDRIFNLVRRNATLPYNTKCNYKATLLPHWINEDKGQTFRHGQARGKEILDCFSSLEVSRLNPLFGYSTKSLKPTLFAPHISRAIKLNGSHEIRYNLSARRPEAR